MIKIELKFFVPRTCQPNRTIHFVAVVQMPMNVVHN